MNAPPAPRTAIPTVYLVDDQQVVRDTLAWLLRSRRLLSEPFSSAEVFESCIDARPVPWPEEPACLLLDARMPDTSGLVLFERLAARRLPRALPVIFLTGHGDVPTTVATVERGTVDVVEKSLSNNALVDRVELALAQSAAALGQRQQAAALSRRLAELAELTEREREELRLVVEGRPNKLIADALQISVSTPEVHRARVFEKMEVRSAVELAKRLRELDRRARRRREPAARYFVPKMRSPASPRPGRM